MGTRSLETATRELNAWLELDLEAMANNLRALRGSIAPGAEVIAVVKANAYGHGAEPIALELEELGAERFAVFSAAEALALRSAGVRRPVLVLGHSFPGDAAGAVQHDITLTLDSEELANALGREARAAGRTARAHLKVDTGLHRFGLAPEDAVALARRLRGAPGLELEGLWTHMANADEADDSFSEKQAAVFAEVARELDWIPYRHTSNSATALRRQGLAFQGVRLGLSLYGLTPAHTPEPGLQPVLSLKARVARVTRLEPGEGVSYGLTWKAARPSSVALVPVGYGDGWRRNLGNRGQVLIGGHRCPIIGRVMMDQFCVDVTEAADVARGDEVVLLGRQGGESIDANEVAEVAGTISWDILASLQARLPRLYHRGGVVESQA
jgi:alanine racemase